MRAFILAVLAAVLLAVVWAYGLSSVQESIATAYTGSSVRFDQGERVNFYGREG
jgi:uncharacterized protein involved in cysteine biosynthesis